MIVGLGVAIVLGAANTGATKVGELQRVAPEPTAALRDAAHRPEIRVTIWYPASPIADEREVTIGPPVQPLFDIGRTASNAAFVDDQRRPVILLSHGFGGTAESMGWFGIALAREGFIVIAVDHPGNNGVDSMTIAGALLWWERAEDLRAALATMAQDPVIGPHMDATRVGVAGFSAGGFAALVSAGARIDRNHFERFCDANPEDGVCAPQRELPLTSVERDRAFRSPEIAAEAIHASADHGIAGVRATFAMAPALIQALDPASLHRVQVPVEIVLGDADTVAPPTTNGIVAASAIPGAILVRLPDVGHYDFLALCTAAGRAALPRCGTKVPRRARIRR